MFASRSRGLDKASLVSSPFPLCLPGKQVRHLDLQQLHCIPEAKT